MTDFCPGFQSRRIQTSGAGINLVTGGSGPPLLLLHGYPQSHLMWRKLAPRLATEFTVVALDLRAYGDSSKPSAGPDNTFEACVGPRPSRNDARARLRALRRSRARPRGAGRPPIGARPS